jgi:hypothetical protein
MEGNALKNLRIVGKWVNDAKIRRFVDCVHVIGGKSRLQPTCLRDERKGLDFKSPSKVHKAFFPSL